MKWVIKIAFLRIANILQKHFFQLGHALSFYHTHKRPDRDEHVQVLWDNVDPNSVSYIV